MTHRPSRPIRNAIEIEAAGQRWRGSWINEGSTVQVESAYGSRSARLGGAPGAEAKAKMLLRELVNEWRNARG